jgi:hypothetical protein
MGTCWYCADYFFDIGFAEKRGIRSVRGFSVAMTCYAPRHVSVVAAEVEYRDNLDELAPGDLVLRALRV